MLILDRKRFLQQLKQGGYRSLGEFCQVIGVHRNSLSRYLSGAPVLPSVLSKSFSTLQVSPLDFLRELSIEPGYFIHNEFPTLVEKILERHPSSAVVLFGSRTKNRAKRYSDIDLGIVGKKPIPLLTLAELIELVETETKDWPVKVDIVDLTRADHSFLSDINRTARFVGGNPKQLQKLEEAA